MAHKMDFSKGKAAFVSYQQPAWHNLGKVMLTDIDTQTALREGGLDFKVEKAPNTHIITGLDPIVSTESFFTYRTDTNKILGTRLGPDYTVYQNDDALSIVDELLNTGKLRIETAGAVYEGRRIFICLKVNDPILIGKDEVSQYILLANGHDGTLAITAMPTNVRVVCWNTLSAALAGAKPHHKIRHTSNAQERVREAFEIMGILEDSKKRNEAAYNAMKCNFVSRSEFFDYIGNIFFTKEEIGQLQKGDSDVISTRKKNMIEGVIEFAETGVGQREALDGGMPNMWYAYNAVTGYLTSKKYGSVDDRFNSLIFGDAASKIKMAGELAVAPQKIETLKRVSHSLNLN